MLLFQVLTVAILFPLEIVSNYLYLLTKSMLPSDVGEGEKWEGPIKKIVSPFGSLFIIANKDMIDDIASSDGNVTCANFYPVTCIGGKETYETCKAGLIGCDPDTNKCPVFFQNEATQNDDIVSGWVCLVFSLFILISCLIGIVTLLRFMLLGASQRIIYKATNINGYIAMMIGCGSTILVQSSSITISTLVPLVGMGVLQLEQMYPLTLGADVGTTFTALMAAMVSNSVQSLQVALVHLFFNLTGIAIWYPIPFLRKIPLAGARRLGKVTRIWSGFPGAFIGINFFLLPLLLIGISACFEVGKRGLTALGIFLVLGLGLGILYFWFWWTCRSGRGKCIQCLYIRNRRKTAIRNLPDDMDYLKVDMEWTKNEIGRLKDFARLPRDRPEEIVGSIRPSIFSEADKEDQISLYESYRSKGWADVLVAAAQSSVEGSLFNTLHRSQQSPHFDDEP
uniref:Sodium-dependent phosphate transport protein 2B n=1 Tax=Attheya septentrionalis TaxID=420275 RepID=A0A7S2UJ46_9STRA|mmetsp:Transcript_27641/g.50175  ORF Transcript_27641/g.50175 Transcript_27641/m.50175 type:complete len:452 (+) Transcript_27641:1002-2357(+)